MDARKPKLTTPQSPLPSTSDLAKALAFYYDSEFNELSEMGVRGDRATGYAGGTDL